MRVCVTSEGKSLDSTVDAHFGRCKYFIIVDTDTTDYEVIENSHAGVSGGAGVQSGQFMSVRGVQAVLTGNVGPNAFQTLNAAGITTYVGVEGSVREAIERFNDGQLKTAASPSVGSKFGTGGS